MIWKPRLARTLAIGALTLTLGASLAAAQDTLTPDADPTFGSATFSPGFLPDPFIMTLASGGPIDASTVDPTCRGYVASAPDYRLIWEENSARLRFLFVGDGDTTMVVQGPDGATTCNDDGFNLNPLVDIANPTTGEYNIWVGSYSSDEFVPGYLMISEQAGDSLAPIQSSLLSEVLGSEMIDTGEPQVLDGLNPDAEGTFGTTTLAPGFTPDPLIVNMISGGVNNVGLLSLGSGCIGYVATNPDYSVNLSGAMAQLIIGFTAEAGDTTLVVRDPTGLYTCNDDTTGSNPEISVSNAPAGQYDIWVGSYSADTNHTGTLSISEAGGSSGPTSITGATSIPPTAVPQPSATPLPAQPAATATSSK